MKVAFLDRDGVINVDFGYVHRWKQFVWVPGAIRAMKKLLAIGFEIIIITNQSGIARGFYTEEDFDKLMKKVKKELVSHNIKILDVFYCPHHIDGILKDYKIKCGCRKPKPGLINQAKKKYEIDLENSILIGDQESDVKAGKAAGINNCILVESCKYVNKEISGENVNFKGMLYAVNSFREL